MLTGKQFGRYTIGDKIGEGGMGEVYAAHDDELDRSVAVKLLPREFSSDEDRRKRFRQEARTASALNHPNIITIHEIGENEHGSFLATELVEGRTLREVIKNERLPLPLVIRIVEQVANALVAAHSAHIVHRDIKPENIMLRTDSIVKVLDFGLAKPTGVFGANDSEASAKTIPGTVMGSARYMSPEQARGHEVDARTDIWSLGVVLYELLAGTAPFKGETTADTIAAVIHKEPESIIDVIPSAPPELLRILRKALQKDREERYQSVKDLALDLKDLLYDIDHANSGNRSAHVTSSPDLNENATMIHDVRSADHRANTTYETPAGTIYSVPPVKRRISVPVALAAIGAVLIGLMGLGYWKWFAGGGQLATNAFDRPQMSRINTDGKVMMPAISPDGKNVAYISGELGSRSLVVRQVSTDSVITVIPPTNLNYSALTFSPNGDYIYYCETRSDFSINTLYQVPTFGGTPKKLIEDVDSPVTFSPDGKQFAFMRHVSVSNEDVIFVVDAATLQLQPITTSKTAGYDFFSARPAWSPDGKTILIGGGKRQSGSVSEMSIGEISIAEKTFKILNSDKFFTVGNFAWFADGSGFLFAARETQTAPVQIWRASYPGLDFHQVTNDFNDYGEVGLSVDGTTLVTLRGDATSSVSRFAPSTKEMTQLTAEGRTPEGTHGLLQTASGQLVYTRREGKDAKLWTADSDGKNPRLIGPDSGSAVSPIVTPDGRQIIFNLQKPGSSRIWRIDIDGKNAVQMTEDSPEHADFNPQLTADGTTVVFQRQITNDERSVLMKMPAAGGPATIFYSENARGVWGPRMSRDGKRIVFTVYDLKTFAKKVVIASLNGDAVGQIERELDFNLINQIAWAPDGKSLTLLSSRAGLPNLWSQPLDGSEPKPITDFKSGQIFNFAWTGDGKNILIARGTINNDLILIRDIARGARSGDVASGYLKTRTRS